MASHNDIEDVVQMAFDWPWKPNQERLLISRRGFGALTRLLPDDGLFRARLLQALSNNGDVVHRALPHNDVQIQAGSEVSALGHSMVVLIELEQVKALLER